jgi:hypothetical protein
MAKLDLLINEPNKDQETQNKQLYLSLQNILNWSNNILTQLAVDFKERPNAGDISITDTNYVAIDGYNQSVTTKNPLCMICLNLQLRGSGYVGVFINGLLSTEIPFNNLSFNPVIHNFYYNINVGQNNIQIKWRANTGTIVKANSTTNPGFNSFQIISFNS